MGASASAGGIALLRWSPADGSLGRLVRVADYNPPVLDETTSDDLATTSEAAELMCKSKCLLTEESHRFHENLVPCA